MKTFEANFKFKIFQYPVLLVINLNLQEKSYRSQKKSSENSKKNFDGINQINFFVLILFNLILRAELFNKPR